MRIIAVVAGLWLSALTGLAQSAVPTPTGISVRMTLMGPIFVDQRGMTLYQRNLVLEQGIAPCPDHPEIIVPLENVGYNQVEEFPMRVPDASSRRSCTDKYPPLPAPQGAQPVGDWSIHVRANGVRQWAYGGKPLHYALKDKAPGQFNAKPTFIDPDSGNTGWGVAAAPLEAPAGIQTRLTSLGLALTNSVGKPLYYAAAGGAAGNERWKPLLVAAAVATEDLPADWSVVEYEDGRRQWVWKKHPLYTYVSDSGDEKPAALLLREFVDVFGANDGKSPTGWQLALLVGVSAPPSGVRVVSSATAGLPASRIYADAQGHTLYTLSCIERTVDRLDCDDVGDSPLYWSSFCGGEDRCRQVWRPLVAAQDARSIDGLWMVAVINPRHPYKPLKQGEQGLPVWTYQGRLVFTYAADKKPGDTWAAYTYDLQGGMVASVIPAFTTP